MGRIPPTFHTNAGAILSETVSECGRIPPGIRPESAHIPVRATMHRRNVPRICPHSDLVVEFDDSRDSSVTRSECAPDSGAESGAESAHILALECALDSGAESGAESAHILAVESKKSFTNAVIG